MRRPPTIELSRPAVGRAEAAAVGVVLRSGWLGLGRETERFEAGFAAFVGARHCVATSSGTAALQLAVALLDLGPEDEVIVPALTFVATAHAVRYAGARVVLADVSRDTLTLDPADVVAKIGPRTRAVIPVHYGGHPCAMGEIRAVARAAGIAVVEDAAHAAGAAYRGRPVGTLSRLTCFSFNAAKNMTTGEGGAVTCASAAAAARLRRLRVLGMTHDTFGRRRLWERRTLRNAPWDYEVRELGWKAAMHDVAAAIGLVQLARLDRLNARRRALAARYVDAFADLGWIELPSEAPWARSSWYTFPIRVRARAALARHLATRGIVTGVHYRPLHRHAFYRDLRADVPVADAAWRLLLLLPLHPTLARSEQARVIAAVRSFDRRGISHPDRRR